jgi:membrane protein DedA with SNARE-associated domain
VSETPRPDPDATAPPAPVEQEADAAREWWQDPSLPWQHKPTRADIACFTWLSVVGIYGIVINILRPGLLASLPHVLASLGSWSGTVLIGAMASGGDPWWPLVWVLGTIGLVKFDWVYWWAGRLWGRELIEVWSARSERARRVNEWAARFARRYETLALALSMVPGVPGRAVVVLVLGEAGTSLAKLLTVSLTSSAVVVGACLAAGYWIGEPAVALMQTYGNYLWYVTLALLVVVVWQSWRASAAKAKA